MTRLSILFVCIGNSCRSPMAEAIARTLGGHRVDVQSAGLTPLGWVAEETINALDALGYPAEGLHSKGFGALNADDFDIVVSLLGKRGLVHIPRSIGTRREGWPIPDPFGEDVEMYRDVARQLERRIRTLLSDELREELFLS